MSSGLGEGRPFTDTVDAGDAETLTYQLPTAGRFDIDAVVADIDNTAGADAKPILYAADPSGAILAKKGQGDPMPGGDSGSATWALRLADSAAAVAGSVCTWAFVKFTPNQVIPSGAATFLTDTLIHTDDPSNYTDAGSGIDIAKPGLYLVGAMADWTAGNYPKLITLFTGPMRAFPYNASSGTAQAEHADAAAAVNPFNAAHPTIHVALNVVVATAAFTARCQAQQNSGVNKTINLGVSSGLDFGEGLTVFRIGDVA